jgi:TatD DNase family protein
MLIDTHAHLDFPQFKDIRSVLKRAEENGIREIITIGINLDSSKRAVDLARKHRNVYATVGAHPHGACLLSDDALESFQDLASNDKVVAVGEIGLDFYYKRQPRSVQEQCLHQQLEFACGMGLPAVFHIRDAYDNFLPLVRNYVSRLKRGILHCFSGNWQCAEECLDLGFYLSIPGIVTFPNAHVLHEVVQRMPLDRLLLETDAPYLTPAPRRGKDNEPALMIHTARKVAELRRMPLEELAEQTTLNAHNAFSIP